MNTEKIPSEKEEVLKIVNEDWPMLEELSKKRFVLNKKKGKDIKESLDVLQSVLEEDTQLAETTDEFIQEKPLTQNQKVEKIVIDKVIEEKTIAQEVIPSPSSQIPKATPMNAVETQNESNESQVFEEIHSSLPKIEEAKLEQPKPMIRKTTFVKPVQEEKVVEEKSLDLFKLIIAGLTHLYVSKTSNLLKPMKFVMDNYKEVSIAALHCIIPLLMTYLITTQVTFVSEQLIKETILMKCIYISVFFFGATFVWISSQVVLSGIYSMLRKSMLEVAKVGKENK